MKERIESLLAGGKVLSASVALSNATKNELTQREFIELNHRIKNHPVVKGGAGFPTSRGRSKGNKGGNGHL